MAEVILNAQRRATGKKAAKATRNSGMVTGVYYVHGTEPIPIAVHPLALRPIVYTADAKVVRLNVGEMTHDCVLKDISFDPVTDRIVHFDLQGVDPNAEVEVEVTVKFIGQAVGVRDGGILEHVMHKLRIACLPTHLPEHIDINIANLGVNSSIHVSEVAIPNVRILEKPDSVIVAVVPPRTEAAAGAAGEPELVGQKGKKED